MLLQFAFRILNVKDCNAISTPLGPCMMIFGSDGMSCGNVVNVFFITGCNEYSFTL